MLDFLLFVRGKRLVKGLPAISSVIAMAVLALSVVLVFYIDALNDAVRFYKADAHVFHGEIWRLFTYTLFHGNGMHLWGNVSALLVFAWVAARCYSDAAWLVTYIGASVAGAMVTVLVHPQASLIGASAGIFGLIGMSIVAAWRCRLDDFENPFGVPLVLLLALMVLDVLIAAGDARAGMLAHFSGMAVGVAAGWLSRLSVLELKRPQK